MSTVGLPHVASARSTASRGSLGSADSSASDRSSTSSRNQRSHGAVTTRASATFRTCNDDNESEYDDDDEEEEHSSEYDDSGSNAHTGNSNDEPQETSSGLWDEVESFLSRPSPSLAVLAKAEKKSTSSSHVLPVLKSSGQQQQQQQQQQRVCRGTESENYSAAAATRAATNRPARTLYQPTPSNKASGSKPIDPKLLQEAFAYAQQVALLDVDDDQQEPADVINDRHHPLGRSGSRTLSSASATSLVAGKDAPRALPPSYSAMRSKQQSSSPSVAATAKSDDGTKKKKATSKSSSAYSSSSSAKPPGKRKSERRIKEAMQWDPSSGGAAGASDTGGVGSSSSSSSSSASRSKHMDPQVMQSLVSNFQHGTTLDELRKELAASQQSMAMSRQVLHDAAKSFFQPSR